MKMAVGSNNFYFYYVNQQTHKEFDNTYFTSIALLHVSRPKYHHQAVVRMLLLQACNFVRLLVSITEFYKIHVMHCTNKCLHLYLRS